MKKHHRKETNALQALPEGYAPLFRIDLQKDKKLALLVNLLALVIGVALCVGMHFVIPITTLFDFSQGLGIYALRFGTLIVGLVAYMILHELIHGVTMKFFGTKKVRYGFTGLYAFAASDDYYRKAPYLVIALAPVVVFGILLALLCLTVSESWFWVVWFLQVSNLSGAAGDLYVTFKFLRLPRDILVRDSGVGMTVYAKPPLLSFSQSTQSTSEETKQ